MKAIMVMFDSLNRRMLEPYWCDWVKTPNFRRLAERSVTFDNSYVGSMPCMPARRELHTGRLNFLHRSWGPIEPFDDSMPELLKQAGVHTHLVSDHYHYWEEGGCNYHTRYNTWEVSRGQEADPWKAHLTADVSIPEMAPTKRPKAVLRQDWVNRHYMRKEKDHSQAKTFALGLEFLRTNHAADNWFLQIETFDPHEPYFSYAKYQKRYPHDYRGPYFDWPEYREVTESPAEVAHLRFMNAALVSMCDAYLGKVLDAMDALDLWKDTMLIVNTDHGFLLGEHDWWAKNVQPFYNEVANTPLFVWDPRCGKHAERRQSLVQTIDLPATLLEFFNVVLPPDMEGRPLKQTILDDSPVRDAALFGMHGGHVNCTNGRYVYMRASNADNQPLYEYTLMPTHMRKTFAPSEFKGTELHAPFRFTKGCPVLKIHGRTAWNSNRFGSLLFDLAEDPTQEQPIQDPQIESMMIDHLVRLMKENDAPPEQFERLGLS